MHFYNNPTSEQQLASLVGTKNPLTEDLTEAKDQEERGENFEAIDRMVCAARDCYIEDGMAWDVMLKHLLSALKKFQGKEDAIADMDDDDGDEDDQADKDSDEDDEESEDE